MSCSKCGINLFFVMPDKYTASTQILVNMKKSSSDLAFQNVQSSLQSVNTYTEIIKSPRILDKYLENLMVSIQQLS